MKDILERIAESRHYESSHELCCRLSDCADEIKTLREDAKRYRWLAERFTGFDFDWMPSEVNAADGKSVLCFEMDKGMRISRDVTASIDAEMAREVTDPLLMARAKAALGGGV